MAAIIFDSMALYQTITDMSSYWTNANLQGNPALDQTTTRFGYGQSFRQGAGSGTFLLKQVSPRNQATQFWCQSFFSTFNQTAGSTLTYGVLWYDAATVQCSLYWRQDGAMLFYRGDGTAGGTLLATFTGAWSSNVWTHFQFKVVIDPSSGSIEIRKNGATSDDFSATGLNTRASANSFANAVQTTTGGAGSFSTVAWHQDLGAWDGDTGSKPNDWIGDVRAWISQPSADTAQKQFSTSAASVLVGQFTNLTSVSYGSTNTQVTVMQISCGIGGYRTSLTSGALTIPGTVTGVTLNFQAAMTGSIRVAIYDDTGANGAPGSLITNGASNTIVNPAIGANNFTFSVNPTLVQGTGYWLVILSTANPTLFTDNATTTTQWTAPQTFGSGFQSTMGPLSSFNQRNAQCWLTVTPGGNFAYVQEFPEDQAISYLQGNNVGDFDLYTTTGVTLAPSAPSVIVGVNLRGFVSKSDVGARQGNIQALSGATSFGTAAQNLSTSWSNFLGGWNGVDPNTSVAWTVSGVNALEIGPKLAA